MVSKAPRSINKASRRNRISEGIKMTSRRYRGGHQSKTRITSMEYQMSIKGSSLTWVGYCSMWRTMGRGIQTSARLLWKSFGACLACCRCLAASLRVVPVRDVYPAVSAVSSTALPLSGFSSRLFQNERIFLLCRVRRVGRAKVNIELTTAYMKISVSPT